VHTAGHHGGETFMAGDLQLTACIFVLT